MTFHPDPLLPTAIELIYINLEIIDVWLRSGKVFEPQAASL